MRKAIRIRLMLYPIFLTLAVIFFFFNLKVLAWIFFALVILPVFIGALILIYRSIKK